MLKASPIAALLSAASTHYRDSARYSTRIAIIDSMMAERETRQRLADLLVSLDELIESRPLTTDLIDRTADALNVARSEFPDEVSITRRSNDFVCNNN